MVITQEKSLSTPEGEDTDFPDLYDVMIPGSKGILLCDIPVLHIIEEAICARLCACQAVAYCAKSTDDISGEHRHIFLYLFINDRVQALDLLDITRLLCPTKRFLHGVVGISGPASLTAKQPVYIRIRINRCGQQGL